MKVHGPNRGERIDTHSSTRTNRATGEVARPAPGERVQVSRMSKLLAGARQPESPDTSRVEALRTAIADGSFKIDPEAIAQAMMDEER